MIIISIWNVRLKRVNTRVLSGNVFLSFTQDLSSSLHGLQGETTVIILPVFLQFAMTSFYNQFSISCFHQLVLQTAILSQSSLPTAAQVCFVFQVHVDFSNTCSLTVNGIARFLQSWQTHIFRTNTISRVIIVTFSWTLCVWVMCQVLLTSW